MVIGFIDHFLGEKNAKIKVLAFKENDNWVSEDHRIIESFPPHGFVFEDSFLHKFPHYFEGDFVLFIPQKNSYAEGDRDQFKIKHLKEKLSYQVVSHKGFMRDDYSIDIESLQEISNELPEKFYLKNERGYYGPFKKVGEIIKAKTGKSVEFRENLNFQLSYSGKTIVYQNPNAVKPTIDVSTKKQLQDWFKDILSKSENGFAKTLLTKSNWNKDILNLKVENIETERSKLNRVLSSIKDLNLTLSELKAFANTSDDFSGIIEKKAELFKNELIEIRKQEIDKEVKSYASEISKLEKAKEQLKREVRTKKDQKDKLETELSYIEENKQRLITDFGIFQQIPPKSLQEATPIITEGKKYFMEISNTYPTAYPDKKSFDESMSAHLSNYGKQSKTGKFRNAREIIASYKCTLIDSLELALSFIHATNNYKYIISQVEVRWLSFQDFWDNGLKDIWESAHASEEILHFLILRDVNLSSPECYAGPLLDLDRGFLKKLPYDGRDWPKNLRIIATCLPVPDIGLHIYQSTFNNWGGIAKVELEKANSKNEPPQLILPVEEFLGWSIAIDDTNNYLEEYITD